MCGDLCCSSCGPAQGNFRCVLCGTWASEGCEHYDEDGNERPEFKEAFAAALAAERKADEALAAAWEEEDKHAQEIEDLFMRGDNP